MKMSERPIKVLLVGSGTVGKTSLCTVYTKKCFPSKYVPTVMEIAFSTVVINDVTHRLAIWDTAGQEDFDRLRLLSYPNTDVFLVCYAIDDLDSFQHVSTKWIPELHKHSPGVPIILVGTKLDKRHKGETLESYLVPYSRGQSLAETIGVAHFAECSALNGKNVSKIFKIAAAAALGLDKKSCCIL
ncbi:rho-related protein racG-like [Daphnia pulex]|uniref:rho-related protein racG-like n=1 Tax=Daphnia pulex TaxID=6669 RepID=UPI001EDCA8F7|nr:rho-related protein racG-like [Daphnia pulex]